MTDTISMRGGVAVRYVEGIEDGVDFDAAYRVDGYSGVAWRLLGWAQEDIPVLTYGEDEDGNEEWLDFGERELADDPYCVVAVMIGDDRRFTFDRDEIHVIPEDGFCHGCGQTGCTAEVWE